MGQIFQSLLHSTFPMDSFIKHLNSVFGTKYAHRSYRHPRPHRVPLGAYFYNDLISDHKLIVEGRKIVWPPDQSQTNPYPIPMEMIFDSYHKNYLLPHGFKDSDDIPASLVRLFRETLAATAEHFGAFSNASRFLLLHGQGDLKYLPDEWWNTALNEASVPSEIDEVWLAEQVHLKGDERSWFFPRVWPIVRVASVDAQPEPATYRYADVEV